MTTYGTPRPESASPIVGQILSAADREPLAGCRISVEEDADGGVHEITLPMEELTARALQVVGQVRDPVAPFARLLANLAPRFFAGRGRVQERHHGAHCRADRKRQQRRGCRIAFACLHSASC